MISNLVESDDKRTINFTLHSTLGIANGLRRVLLGETPSLAIDLVEFESNNTVLDDDILSHRIGLITLQSDNVDNFRFKHECDCEYACDLCSVKFVCNVKNDVKNDQNPNQSNPNQSNPNQSNPNQSNPTDQNHPKIRVVTTGDLISFNPNVECANKNLPIVKLGPGEEIKFTGIACKDIGNEHAKFCPVNIAICKYKVDPKANIKTRFQQENNPNTFEFEIETNSSMKAINALRLAIDILVEKLDNFETALKNNTI